MGGKKDGNAESGILLLAKRSGLTSFASLSAVKRALKTKKVGHTGTLDSFADGLLVVLAGHLTHLVPHITAFTKEYKAILEFGRETDTLDPTGNVILTGKIPSEDEIRSVLPNFLGKIQQTPPAFSALHINGKRASDLAREGIAAEIPSREIEIFSIELKEFRSPYALFSVCCSKGTYIRSLARDIARACGSVAHLAALRRTKVGSFDLADAFGAESLAPFTIDSLLQKKLSETAEKNEDESFFERMREVLQPMTAKIAFQCGMESVLISSYFSESFSHGRPINAKVFSHFFSPICFKKEENRSSKKERELAVFYPKGKFAGVIRQSGKKFSYSFVVPHAKKIAVYAWDEIVSGQFCAEFREKGTALTIGSFDGPHIGHDALFDDVLSFCKNGVVPGVVTFTKSLRGMKIADYSGDVATLSQRLEVFAAKGFAFAIVIDFSDEFARMSGIEFLTTLVEKCAMKHLAEGKDFHCGYRGSTDMAQILDFSKNAAFSVTTVNSVMFGSERVSSSRVRESVLCADFDSVRYMLDRPFSIDCSVFEWKTDGSFIFAQKRGVQIFPPDGTYKVLVIMSAEKKSRQQSGEAQSSVSVRAYRSDCILSGGILRLPAKEELIGGFVRAVQFGYPDENIFKE